MAAKLRPSRRRGVGAGGSGNFAVGGATRTRGPIEWLVAGCLWTRLASAAKLWPPCLLPAVFCLLSAARRHFVRSSRHDGQEAKVRRAKTILSAGSADTTDRPTDWPAGDPAAAARPAKPRRANKLPQTAAAQLDGRDHRATGVRLFQPLARNSKLWKPFERGGGRKKRAQFQRSESGESGAPQDVAGGGRAKAAWPVAQGRPLCS